MSLREQLYDRRKDESVTSSPAFFPRFPGTTFAILSNVVAAGCNRSVERSRYAESLSEEREQ